MSLTIFESEKRLSRLQKTRSSKSRKIGTLLKRLTHGFGPKMAIFATFFLGNIDQENVVDDIVERKNAFVGYRNKRFKKSQNLTFFQRD